MGSRASSSTSVLKANFIAKNLSRTGLTIDFFAELLFKVNIPLPGVQTSG